MSWGSPPIQSPEDFPPFPPSNTKITLQVGERHFTTLASTLIDGSAYFASLLSGRWPDSQSSDGSYFVDADPDLFEHILRFLRRGVLPIIYDKSRGFDHAFYQALREEAGYFGIKPLREWAEERTYTRAVTIKYSVEEVSGEGIHVNGYNAVVNGNTERSYHPSWGTRKVYRCPRGISGHNGNSFGCGKACARAKDDDGSDYVDQEILRTMIVTKTTVFHNMDSGDLKEW
jgi:hypothetical protein